MSESSSIAQKVDTQARVIRSLNLIHCADTQHMVGAVELERLLIQDAEHDYQKQYIKRMERQLALLRMRCNCEDVMVVNAILRSEEEAKP